MLLDDIKDYLVAQNVGVFGTDLFAGQIPDKPDICVAIFEYGGSPSPLVWNGIPVETPGLQVRVRNKTYQAGRLTCETVKNKLHGLNSVVLGSTRYLMIRANQSAPEPMGRDNSGRQEWVINFTVMKEVG